MVTYTKKGDIVLTAGSKRIRFNNVAPHGYKPHFHIEESFTEGGKVKWRDIRPHMYFFKE